MTYSPEYAAAVEADRASDIDAERETIHDLLADIAGDTAMIRRALARLGEGPGNLYDVEVAEGSAADVAAAALTQITVAVAALSAVIPKPEGA